MKKYKVQFNQRYHYTCEHTIEATSEEEAMEKVSSLDNHELDYREESDSYDYDFEVEEIC
jgi:hypothetical protein